MTRPPATSVGLSGPSQYSVNDELGLIRHQLGDNITMHHLVCIDSNDHGDAAEADADTHPAATVYVPNEHVAGYLVVRRGFGLVGQGGSAPFDFGDDLLGGLCPDEGFGVVVPV